MPKKFIPQKTDDGTYISANLNDRQFNQLFNKIEKAQKKARRNAKRTLRPSTFNNPTSKALKALGEKAKGQRFTKADLEQFDKNRQRHMEKYDAKTAGIPYSFLVKNSRKIDIDRANNRVDDGTGINRANLIGIKGNVVLIRVGASMASKHQEHKVKVRLEQWDELLKLPPDTDTTQAAQMACAGRLSFDCDCGRHQYWYRYLGTMGNYQLSPPKEFAFPKIKNPELSGVACKHVLLATTKLQSKAWHRILAKQLEAQAKRVGFGSDNRTYILSKDEKKAAAKNRKNTVDQEAANKEYRRYLRASKALEKKIKQRGTDKEKIKRLARGKRKATQEAQKLRDSMKAGFMNFADSYKMQGKTKAEAITDFAKMMNLSESKLKGMVK